MTLVADTHDAFAYLQGLYTEVALLIQEIEDHLRREEERFTIATPSGYSVTNRGSSGIDGANVKLWLMRKFGIFFVPEAKTELKGGSTFTPLSERILYFRFILDQHETIFFDKQALKEPSVLFGVFAETERVHKKFEKFESVLIHIEYNDDRVFADLPRVNFKDAYVGLRGTLGHVPLFALNDSKAVAERLVRPAIELFRRPPSD
jgi:hypothetical protein